MGRFGGLMGVLEWGFGGCGVVLGDGGASGEARGLCGGGVRPGRPRWAWIGGGKGA